MTVHRPIFSSFLQLLPLSGGNNVANYLLSFITISCCKWVEFINECICVNACRKCIAQCDSCIVEKESRVLDCHKTMWYGYLFDINEQGWDHGIVSSVECYSDSMRYCAYFANITITALVTRVHWVLMEMKKQIRFSFKWLVRGVGLRHFVLHLVQSEQLTLFLTHFFLLFWSFHRQQHMVSIPISYTNFIIINGHWVDFCFLLLLDSALSVKFSCKMTECWKLNCICYFYIHTHYICFCTF